MEDWGCGRVMNILHVPKDAKTQKLSQMKSSSYDPCSELSTSKIRTREPQTKSYAEGCQKLHFRYAYRLNALLISAPFTSEPATRFALLAIGGR